MRYKLAGIIWGLSFVILFVVFALNPNFFLGVDNHDALRAQVESAGVLGPILYIIIQIVQVVIFPIPGLVITLAGGFLFGWFLGGVDTLIGITVGSLIAFKIGRTFGRPFIEKFIGKQDIAHWEKYYKKKEKLALFISRAIPLIVPSDLISYVASITPIKFKEYAWITFLGFIPHIFIVTFFGAQLAKISTPVIFIFYGLTFVVSLIFLIKIPLKKIHHRRLHNSLRKKKSLLAS